MARNEDEFNDLLAREMQTLEIRLVAKATRTAVTIDEYIQTRMLNGTDIETIRVDLLTDLEEGGRIFGEFRNAIRATVHGNMTRIRDVSQFANQGIDIKYRWVAVLINTCPDCMDRHNSVKTWGDWEEEGMPRTGQTVCGEHCNCMLVPAETTREIDPIKRG